MHRRLNNNFLVGYLKFCATDSHQGGYTNIYMHQTMARRNIGIKSSPFENPITRRPVVSLVLVGTRIWSSQRVEILIKSDLRRPYKV